MSEKAAEQSNEETAGGRRRAIKTLGGIALASLLPAPWVRAASTVKIGYVSPQTGPLAVFCLFYTSYAARGRARVSFGGLPLH